MDDYKEKNRQLEKLVWDLRLYALIVGNIAAFLLGFLVGNWSRIFG